jgi:hypothetical protein
MAAQLGTHPSADALRGFAAGQLDERTATLIMNPINGCPDCGRVAAALSGDDILDRLRRAHRPSSTPPPPSRRLAARSSSPRRQSHAAAHRMPALPRHDVLWRLLSARGPVDDTSVLDLSGAIGPARGSKG